MPKRNLVSCPFSPSRAAGVALPRLAAGRSPPNIAAPAHQPLSGAGGRDGGANVEIEDGLAGGLGRAGIVVDDIADLPMLAVDGAGDEPVVAVEGRLGAVCSNLSVAAAHDGGRASFKCRDRRGGVLTRIWRGTASP